MDPNFWHDRWAKNEIAFHEGKPNAFLTAHFPLLALTPGNRVFIPLCGKTRDIAWLLNQGYQVAGAELSRSAIDQLFAELGVKPDIKTEGPLTRYSAPNIDIFVGDIFDLTGESLGPVNAVYDRAALVALPPAMRERYAPHLRTITRRAPQLLLCFVYDQALQPGPPFSVNAEEVKRHYEKDYSLALVEDQPLPNGLRGKCPAQENVWLLKPRR